MGKTKIEQDLRDAGLRKKRARKVARAADRGRAGDRAARQVVDRHATALRNSITALVSHAKPPRSKSAKKSAQTKSTRKVSARKAPAKTNVAKKASAKRTPTKRASAPRSISKSTSRSAGRKARTKKVGAA